MHVRLHFFGLNNHYLHGIDIRDRSEKKTLLINFHEIGEIELCTFLGVFLDTRGLVAESNLFVRQLINQEIKRWRKSSMYIFTEYPKS